MPVPIFRRIDGRYGRIEIEHLGGLAGEIANWTLTRRAGIENPNDEFFDLHAVLSWVTAAVFNDKEYVKRIIVHQAGKSRQYRLEPQGGPGQRTVLTGRSLVMEKVRLCPVE